MLNLGVQTKNIVNDENPADGYKKLKEAGFSCVDFSLNSYLLNSDLYKGECNSFFERSVKELEEYFVLHKKAATQHGVRIWQMHMPYPIYVPGGKKELNTYLQKVVAAKSMEICRFLECPYIVVHGMKLTELLGTEEAEWGCTEKFLHTILPLAKEYHITVCIENLYSTNGLRIMEGPCCDAKKAVARIKRINEAYDAEVLGFCFDTGHANLVGIDMERFITTLASHLKVLHIHDNDGVGDLHQIPFVFTKTRENKPSTDWDGFVRGLRNIQYQGVLSFETAPVLTAFPEVLKADALGLIAHIGEYFLKEIEK